MRVANAFVVTRNILQAFRFFQGCSEAERLALVESAAAVHLQPGTMFYSEGDETGNFGLVGSGDIRVFKTTSSGRELTLYHVRDGQPCLINLLCVVLNRGAMASAVIEEPTDAMLVPADVFRNLLTKSEALRRFVFETTASRVVDILALVEEITVRRMDARLASLLLRRAAESRVGGAIVATHDELAAELGTAREVVSRVLKEMERRGALRLARGHIVVLDERVLAGFAH
jgi:CRP/FNR family transcriptional regulator, anaerobic regulatory protein